ncbi:MAG: aldo/keto reductase, partial [Planctomycetota bacterium]
MAPAKLITNPQELVVELQRKPFGSTGLNVPPIVFGSTSLGNLFVAPSIAQKRAVVESWFEHVDTPVVIDTAGKYGAGLSLECLGTFLKEMQVSPDQVIISNKLAWRRVPLTTKEPTFEPGVWVDLQHDAVQDISYEGILRCHEKDCQLLGDYYPKLVSVHDPDEYLAAASDDDDRKRRMDDITGAYNALMELKRDGKVAGVGIGAKDWTTIREITSKIELDWVMIANSFTIHSHPRELVSFIESQHDKGVAIINSAVFNGGFVVGGEFYNYQPIDPETEK